MKIKILVVVNKPPFQKPDGAHYFPIQSGASLNEKIDGTTSDATGDSISNKNLAYNEMCAIYWFWKNLNDADIVGLFHYRRYLTMNKRTLKKKQPLSDDEITNILSKYDVILPKPKLHLFKTAEYSYLHFGKAFKKMHKHDLDVLKNVIATDYPDYLKPYLHSLKSKKGHGGHLFIMKRELFNNYCEFMFSLSSKLEIALADRPDKTRYISSLTERMMDAWVEKKRTVILQCTNSSCWLEKQSL
jgi:hypothetical protein